MKEEKAKKEDLKSRKSAQKPKKIVVDEKKLEKADIEIKTEKKGEKKKDQEKPITKKKKKKIRRQVLRGQVHIQCTYNNTLVAFSDLNGKILVWSSAGSLGFKGAKKATPYAATQIVNSAAEKVAKYGLKEIEVFVKGVGSGREASIRALANNDFEIILIKDVTPIPHNGCRPRKLRRV